MVAHEKESIQPEHTFRSLYLSPIQKAVELGMIDDFGFHLLIDSKTEGYATLEAIVKDAADFKEMLYTPPGGSLLISRLATKNTVV